MSAGPRGPALPYSVTHQPAGARATPATPVTRATPESSSFDLDYPVPLIDGSTMTLPLRALPNGKQAIALLMSNQTPFAVESALAPLLLGVAERLAPEVIVAVPTMGLDYARLVARGLGHADYVALGLSRKFWYDDALSERMSSSTSPDQTKSIYLDPALVSRVRDRRVLLVDDVINTGVSAAASIRLLQRAGARLEGMLVTLTEGHAWRQTLAEIAPDWPQRVHAIGHIPMFDLGADGKWHPSPSTT